jgi:hypothetical protein
MFGGVAQQVLLRRLGAKITPLRVSEDAPEARGDVRTSVALPVNSAPDPIYGTPLGCGKGA